jgi:hypothetical protein
MDNPSIALPCSRNEHPLYRREYRVATPSIEKFWEVVLDCLKKRIPGAMIYAKPRFGKTHAIQYIRLLLEKTYPNLPTYHIQASYKTGTSEGAFFSHLMAAVHVPIIGNMPNITKRMRLKAKILEHVQQSGGNWAVFFCDEAQRYSKHEYEWLRDLHDELNHHNVRLFVFLVGQPQLLTQKMRFRDSGDEQIVMRFMVDELQFRGILTAEDMATCLCGYDATVYPEGSGWSFTRYYYPRAFDAGYRLANDAAVLWQAFKKIHDDHGLPGKIEIPMDYFSRAIEYLLLEAGLEDQEQLQITPQHLSEAVMASRYVEAFRAYSGGVSQAQGWRL